MQIISRINQLWEKIRHRHKTETNVYFISGMCYNCSVFDNIILPNGFRKRYIEWYIPDRQESIREYALRMSKDIDTSSPFILVGYSFGAVIVQEMGQFLNPIKIIVISSFKSGEETPMIFKAAKRSQLLERLPDRLYESTDFITETFNRLVYHMPTDEISKYMTVTDPAYIKWAARRITEWTPPKQISPLYHIHGTEDQIFPFELITRNFPVESGDHLMVIKKADTVSHILASILLMKEN